MHILMILHASGLNIPIRTQLTEVFGTYLSKDHKVSVIIFSERDRNYRWKGFEIYEIKTSKRYLLPIYLIKFIRRLRKVRANGKIDIIFGRNCYVIGNAFYPIAKVLDIPLVLQLTFPIREIQHANYFLSKILILILKGTINISDRIMPISHGMGDYLEKWLKIPKDKIYSFPDGVNLETFQLQSSIKDKKYSIIYLGLINKRRKLSFLIKVMKIVVEEIPSAKLIIVGDGDDRRTLQELSNKLKLENNIIFTGRVPYSMVPQYLSSAKIGVVPLPPTLYYKISSPLKLFEYMGAGLAVIANREIIEHEEALMATKGGKVPPYNEKQFASAIIELLKQEENIEVMGKNNISWVKNNRDYESLAKSIENNLISTIKDFKK